MFLLSRARKKHKWKLFCEVENNYSETDNEYDKESFREKN